ncbi:MAG: nucleotidyltransferase family protein [Dehalococcoidia bacterium]
MQLASGVEIPYERLEAFSRKWDLTEVALFGSIVTDHFRPDSDVDVLVTFSPSSTATLFAMVHMREELEEIFGRKVDLLTRAGVERSRNYIRRKAILESARTIYAA